MCFEIAMKIQTAVYLLVLVGVLFFATDKVNDSSPLSEVLVSPSFRLQWSKVLQNQFAQSQSQSLLLLQKCHHRPCWIGGVRQSYLQSLHLQNQKMSEILGKRRRFSVELSKWF